MSSVQLRSVLAATLLSESAWIYATMAVVGLGLSVGGSPLGWIAVLAVLGVSFLVARGLSLYGFPGPIAYPVQMVSGVIAIYLVMSTQIDTGISGVDLGWAGHLSSGTEDEAGTEIAQGNLRPAILGVFMGAALWWKGGRTASTEEPLGDLQASFKLGTLALALSAVVDIFHTADLNVFPMMFVFFGAALAGLSIGHLLPPSHRATEERAWPRVIGGVVAVVVITGLIFSALQKGVLTFLSTPVVFLLKAMAKVVFYVVVLPLSFLVEWLTRALSYLLTLFLSEPEGEEAPDRASFTEVMRDLEEGEIGDWAALLLQALEWTIVTIVAVVVLYILARAFRRRVRLLRAEPEATHESVMEDADPALDMARLLLNLIPGRFRRTNRRKTYNLPEDEAGIVEVFRVYFGLLNLAEDRGLPRSPAETPVEYQRKLERIFPSGLVRMATAAFTRACYGHQPAGSEQIAEMRAALEQLRTGAR